MGSGRGKSRRAQASAVGVTLAQGVPKTRDGHGDDGWLVLVSKIPSVWIGGAEEGAKGLCEPARDQDLLGTQVELLISAGPQHPDYEKRDPDVLRGLLQEREMNDVLAAGRTTSLFVGDENVSSLLLSNWGTDYEVEITVWKLGDGPGVPRLDNLSRVEF